MTEQDAASLLLLWAADTKNTRVDFRDSTNAYYEWRLFVQKTENERAVVINGSLSPLFNHFSMVCLECHKAVPCNVTLSRGHFRLLFFSWVGFRMCCTST